MQFMRRGAAFVADGWAHRQGLPTVPSIDTATANSQEPLMTTDLRSPTFQTPDRRNDRVFAATLLAMAAGLLVLPLALLQAPADTTPRASGATASTEAATVTVTVLEPVVITGRRSARSAAAEPVEPASARRI